MLGSDKPLKQPPAHGQPEQSDIRIGKLRSALAGLLFVPVGFAPLFLSAWTLNFWEAWLFIANFSICSIGHGLYIVKNSPGLLERRMRIGPSAEKRPAQKIIVSCIFAIIVLLQVVAGFDRRFGWSDVPPLIVIAAEAVIVLSFVIFNIVGKENAFASATIEVTAGQKVISTGPYALVRHPMYSGALLLTLAIPIAWGSWWALIVMPLMVPILIWRITDEENFLKAHLEGYARYCDKVRYRLIPGLY